MLKQIESLSKGKRSPKILTNFASNNSEVKKANDEVILSSDSSRNKMN
jgi:hypothetical protein